MNDYVWLQSIAMWERVWNSFSKGLQVGIGSYCWSFWRNGNDENRWFETWPELREEGNQSRSARWWLYKKLQTKQVVKDEIELYER